MNRVRRWAIGALAAFLTTLAAGASAQAPSAQRRIAIPLAPSTASDPIGPTRKAWAAEFARQGLVDGRDIEITIHRAKTFNQEEWSTLARHVAETRPDVIVTVWIGMVPPLARHARDIPIVGNVAEEFLDLDESPIQGRPGRNVTGVLIPAGELLGLQAQLLKELRPGAKRIAEVTGAVERTKGQRAWKRRWSERKIEVVRSLGMDLRELELEFDITAEALGRSLREARPDVALVNCTPATGKREFWEQLAAIGIASAANCPAAVENGALMGSWSEYGAADIARIATKIVRGERASNIPMERPRNFGLAINLRTAKTLGITIPPAVLVRATQVFE